MNTLDAIGYGILIIMVIAGLATVAWDGQTRRNDPGPPPEPPTPRPPVDPPRRPGWFR